MSVLAGEEIINRRVAKQYAVEIEDVDLVGIGGPNLA